MNKLLKYFFEQCMLKVMNSKLCLTVKYQNIGLFSAQVIHQEKFDWTNDQ